MHGVDDEVQSSIFTLDLAKLGNGPMRYACRNVIVLKCTIIAQLFTKILSKVRNPVVSVYLWWKVLELPPTILRCKVSVYRLPFLLQIYPRFRVCLVCVTLHATLWSKVKLVPAAPYTMPQLMLRRGFICNVCCTPQGDFRVVVGCVSPGHCQLICDSHTWQIPMVSERVNVVIFCCGDNAPIGIRCSAPGCVCWCWKHWLLSRPQSTTDGASIQKSIVVDAA